MKSIKQLEQSLTEASSRLITLSNKYDIKLCNKRINFIKATLAKRMVKDTFFEGSNIIVESRSRNGEYKVTNKNNGDTWYSRQDGSGSIPEEYMDTAIESEFLRGMKVMSC